MLVLNNIDPERISFLKEDATEFMKAALLRGESWDIVVIDPRKLAPSKKALQGASGVYRNLNLLAMQLIKRGGLLMTAVTQSGIFLRILQENKKQLFCLISDCIYEFNAFGS